MARLSILTNDEINALYAIPTLNDEDRLLLFELENDDVAYLNTLKNAADKINYILQLGYYRAVSYFFKFSFQKVSDDVNFILKRYFPNTPFPKKQIERHRHYDNREQVCKKFNLSDATTETFSDLLFEAKRLAKIHVLPKFVLTGLLTYCQQQSIIKPAYTKFQEVVAYSRLT